MSPKSWVVLAAAAVASLLACASPTAGGGNASVLVLGQWDYAATQTSPTPATLVGTLSITRQTGRDFQGSLDVTERDGQGNVRRLSGIVSGQALDAASLDFDAFFAVTSRHHLGALARDSIRGTWVEQTSSDVTSSGSFAAARPAAP